MTISKIHIENIRGFEKVSLTVNLRPNCTNILVAPNGFGKSSISTAFNCAKGTKLNVDEKDKHKKKDTTASYLSIECDEGKLQANSTINEITEKFDIHVIKSNIEPKAKLPKINGFTIAKPYLEIPSLDLGPVFDKENIKFNINKYKPLFGNNSKVVPNIPNQCSDELLRSELLRVIDSIDKLKQKKSSDLFKEMIETVKGLNGTKTSISDKVQTEYVQKVDELPHLKAVFDVVMKYGQANTWLDGIIICYILMDLCGSDRPNLKKWLQYAVYSRRLQSLKDFIRDINGAWVTAEIKETKGRILVNFPDASSLSNGQRDLLYFGCNLLRTQQTTSTKPCILLIDEVFDYLDDANIVVAQYFMSKLIDTYREDDRKIYICLLTHLDPLYFKGYALKRQQTVYLGETTQRISETMRKVISHRDDTCWAADLSRHFLHYHPDNRDISEVFNITYELPKKHGRSHGFYEFLKEEWDKCIAGVGSYDPFAVCAYVRVKIEQCAYLKIQTQPERETFLLERNGTTNKLEFVESIGIPVPEACLLLGVVYNDAMHRKGAIDQSSTIALKLKNLGLQSMMKQAINW
ncbi:ATP-binding protein [Agrobacterium leguminum]|uniref:ATP-binding protein n=1 Tax=Agrobacterium leguminum TaxID=2792015 RepID=UPI0022B85106|nr:ATP-binding protein [Agrobacterium leguminum]MCZ7933834.1 ATP-binding protein [Agrobacterium leguminum]